MKPAVPVPDSHVSESEEYMRSVVQLFSHAHMKDDLPPEDGDTPVPSPRLGIGESVHLVWPHVAELWFLGMQSEYLFYVMVYTHV